MLDIVTMTSVAMVVSNLLMFAVGTRLRRSHRLASMLLIGVITAIAWFAQSQITGRELPVAEVLLVAVVLGGTIVTSLPNWNPAGHAAFAATVAGAFAYIGYAGFVLVNAQLGPFSLSFAAVLFFLQFSTLCLLVGTMFETIDIVCRTRWQGPGGRKTSAGPQPMVSIHVPTYAEPPDLVIRTLDALARLDYPNFEVLVIDNNTSNEELWRPVEAHCAKLGDRFRFFHLLPWPGFKSGALNFAVGETAAKAQLIAVVDSDYVVEPNFLKDLTGHFEDPAVAFVQSPQDYRDGQNRGRYGRALYLAFMYFFQVSMPSRNESNSIIYAGTMGLIRKSALQEVGGWSEWCITEDAELSLRLLAAGHKSVFIRETFGRGLMPLDLAGLKKQRFRWAFGGMQLLRMHFGELLDPRSRLSFAQRFGFLNGGLQWLNDLLAILYTIVLFIGTASLVFSGSFFSHALTQGILIISPLFLFLSIIRFLWAFRVQNRCSWREAADAMSVLIGLTWVVGLACIRGLFSKEGVFLRTPKQSAKPSLSDAFKVVRIEGLLAFICLAGAAGILATGNGLTLARGITVGLLLWQAATFLAAVRLSAWSHTQLLGADSGSYLIQAVRSGLGTYITEVRAAGSVALVAGLLGILFFTGVMRAPQGERTALADPLDQFIPARTVLPVSDRELAGAVLVQEAAAAKAGNVDAALGLWSSDGRIIDWAGSRDGRPGREWSGLNEIRTRYREELLSRRYLSLAHTNARITRTGAQAVIVNDLKAVVIDNSKKRRIFKRDADRWTLRRSGGKWYITRLEVNRT